MITYLWNGIDQFQLQYKIRKNVFFKGTQHND